MSTRAMIFDFDGTIADTFMSVIEILNGLSGEYGYPAATAEELPALMALTPRQLAVRMGLSWHQLPSIALRVRREMTRNMGSIRPFKGIPPALAALRERGVLVGMLTSNSRENVDGFLAVHPELRFDFVSTGSGLFGKHHRLERLLKRERIAASDACYVGDEVRDIEAAHTVGMRMIAVAWGFSAPQLLAASKPEHLIADPAELLALV